MASWLERHITGKYDILARASGVKYAILPVNEEKEYQIFFSMIQETSFKPNFEAMCRIWNLVHAHGIDVFYKLPEHLLRHYNVRALRRQNERSSILASGFDRANVLKESSAAISITGDINPVIPKPISISNPTSVLECPLNSLSASEIRAIQKVELDLR